MDDHQLTPVAAASRFAKGSASSANSEPYCGPITFVEHGAPPCLAVSVLETRRTLIGVDSERRYGFPQPRRLEWTLQSAHANRRRRVDDGAAGAGASRLARELHRQRARRSSPARLEVLEAPGQRPVTRLRVPPARAHRAPALPAPRSAIRVLIVDDHAVVRSGLSLVVGAEDDLEVVGEAGKRARRDLRGAHAEARRDPAGRRHARPERPRRRADAPARAPETKVLVLSMQDDPQYVRQAFAEGASGYVLKEAADTEVVAAIREVARGGQVRPSRARCAADRGRGRGCAPGGGGPALRPRTRGLEAAGARPHEPGDREAALHLGPNGRDAPRAHHAEAPPVEPGGARALRARAGRARASKRRDGRPEAASSEFERWSGRYADGATRTLRALVFCLLPKPNAVSGLRSAPPIARIANPMPGEQEGDADHDAEERELLGHVARVERGRQRGLGHPEVASRVVDRLSVSDSSAFVASLCPCRRRVAVTRPICA